MAIDDSSAERFQYTSFERNAVFDQMGEPIACHGPPLLRLLFAAGVMGFLGGMWMCCGLSQPAMGNNVAGKDILGPCILAGGVLALAVGLLIFAARLARVRILLCPRGLVVKTKYEYDVYPWEQLLGMVEVARRDQLEFIPMGVYRAATVYRRDGAYLLLTRNRVKRVTSLIDAIRVELWARYPTVTNWPGGSWIGDVNGPPGGGR